MQPMEIERKFLVTGDFKKYATEKKRITQGYISSVPQRSVRVRIMGSKAFLTIKGETSSTGMSRLEWEKEISVEEAELLLTLCEPGIIDKTRYLVRMGDHTFEVDEFHGDNQGLVVAEIELTHEEESFPTPDWLGKEVTGDKRYYNAMLVKDPFTNW